LSAAAQETGSACARLDVFDLYGATLKHNPTNYVPSVNGEWMAVKIFRELRGEAVARDTMIPFAFG